MKILTKMYNNQIISYDPSLYFVDPDTNEPYTREQLYEIYRETHSNFDNVRFIQWINNNFEVKVL